MSSKNHIVGFSVMLLLLSVSTASAFYKLDSTGASRSNSEGFNVPFPHALQMIQPSGWSVVVQGDMGIAVNDVSWGNEATWEEAVLATAKQANSSVKIDYTDKKIFVRRNPPARFVLRSTPQGGYAQPVPVRDIAGEYVLEEIPAVGSVRASNAGALVASSVPTGQVNIAQEAAFELEKRAKAAEKRAEEAEARAAKALRAAEEAQAVTKAIMKSAETNVGAKTLAETKALEASKAAEQATLRLVNVKEESSTLIAAAQMKVKAADEARMAAEKKAVEALEAARLAEEKLAQAEEAKRMAEARVLDAETRVQEVEASKDVAMQKAAQEAVKEVTTVEVGGQRVDLPIWSLAKGSLKAQLAEWAQREGYQFTWRPAFDVTINANVEVHGTLHDAFAKVLDGLRGEGTRLSADIYESNKLIIVTGD